MAATAPPTGDPDQQKRARSPEMAEADAPEVWPEVDALVEENKLACWVWRAGVAGMPALPH